MLCRDYICYVDEISLCLEVIVGLGAKITRLEFREDVLAGKRPDVLVKTSSVYKCWTVVLNTGLRFGGSHILQLFPPPPEMKDVKWKHF